MDPFSALLIACLVAGYFTRNVTQDMVYKARGEDPPSYRRQQERAKRRADYMADPGPAGRFWANAWADAWASADERRARMQAKAAQRRRHRWAEDDAHEINDRVWTDQGDENGPTFDPDTDVFHEPTATHVCQWCSQKVVDGQTKTVTLATGHSFHVCAACAAAHQRRRGDTDMGACLVCQKPVPCAELGPVLVDPDDPESWTAGCYGCQNAAKDANKRAEQEDDQTGPETGEPTEADAIVIDMGAYKRPAAAPEPIKENDVSGETTNLSAALAYTNDMATQAAQGAASVETSIASLTVGGVTGPTLTHLAQAQEALSQAMAQFTAANTALSNHIAVKEAYNANRDAGTREFVTAD